MKVRITIASAILVAMGLLQAGCTSGVSLTSVWKDPGYSGPAKKNVLIIGLARTPEGRIQFENQLTHELTSRGVGAMASVDGMPGDTKIDKETVVKYFSEKNLDAILVTGLMSADTINQYTPGTTYAMPVGYYHSWYGYYGSAYTVHHSPGYWTTTAEFVLESNLYDATTDKLIWRGISKAVNPESSIEVIQELSKILVQQLEKDGIVVFQKGD